MKTQWNHRAIIGMYLELAYNFLKNHSDSPHNVFMIKCFEEFYFFLYFLIFSVCSVQVINIQFYLFHSNQFSSVGQAAPYLTIGTYRNKQDKNNVDY